MKKYQMGGAAGKMPPPVLVDDSLMGARPGAGKPIRPPGPPPREPGRGKPPVLVDDSLMGARPGAGKPIRPPGPPPREQGRGKAPMPPVKMAKGGSASKRADGCAQRGKTKGKMI